MKPRLMIFDVDGTLVDSLTIGYAIDSQIVMQLGGKIPNLETYRRQLGEKSWEDFIRDMGVVDPQRAISMYYEQMQSQHFDAIPGAKSLLSRIANTNIPISIVSVNDSMESVINRLENAGLKTYFEVDSIQVVREGKAEAIRKECRRREVQPFESMYIGDTARDVREAKAVGVKTVAVSNNHSYNPIHLIRQANPDYIIGDIRVLSTLLETEQNESN